MRQSFAKKLLHVLWTFPQFQLKKVVSVFKVYHMISLNTCTLLVSIHEYSALTSHLKPLKNNNPMAE